MYAEFATDPVIQPLAFEDQRHYIVLLCLHCNGVIDRKVAKPVKDRIILRALGLDDSAGGEVKRRLIEMNLIDKNWQVTGWDKRQYISDHSTQRSRNSRKSKQSRNDVATAMQHPCNAPDTDTDTDTDTETKGKDKDSARARATPTPEIFPVTPQMRDWGLQNAPGIALEDETQRFLDHHRAKGSRFKDWLAAWRNWVRKAVEFDNKRPRGGVSAKTAANLANAQAAMREV